MASHSFEAHARTVTLLTLLSRISGLARDATLSRIFGAGLLMDAFFFAFMIPNLFRRLFGEGALSAAFLPAYTRLAEDDPRRAARLATLVVGVLSLILGALVIVAEVLLLIWQAGAPDGSLAARLTIIMLPYTPMVCVVAILGAMLQVHGRFGPTAAAPILLNIAIMATALGAGALMGGAGSGPVTTMTLVAAAVIVAGVLQVIWSLAALRRHHRWERDLRGAVEPARAIASRAIPMVVGLGVLQLNTFFDGLIASYPSVVGGTIFGLDYPLDEGAMASVSFATRLYQFPLGVFGIAVATAIFPALARQTNDLLEFASTLRRGLRLVMFIGLPASAGLLVVGEPLAQVVLGGGEFDTGDAHRVARVLAGFAPAIWAYSMTHVLTRSFYARGDVRRPVKLAIAMVGLNLLLNCLLIWTPLREAGLAWSTATCAALQAAILLAMSRRNVPALLDRSVRSSWLATAILTVIMTVVLAFISSWLPDISSWRGALGELAALVAAGALIVVAGAAALRMPELRWALGRSDP